MRRRDFNHMALSVGLGTAIVNPPFGRESAAALADSAMPAAPTVITKATGRTYNQLHLPRKYMQGQRRFSVYWAWNYPWEANRDVTELDNRFSTMTEVRRVEWPFYEKPEYAERMFLQGIAGTLPLVPGQVSKVGRRSYGSACFRLPTHRPGGSTSPA